MNQFRRWQTGRYWQPPKEEPEETKPRVGEFLKSIKLTRRPTMVESIGTLFSQSLNAAMGANPDVPAKRPAPPPVPLPPSLSHWWARMRTAIQWLPLYNVDWVRLAEEHGDMPESFSDASLDWAGIEAYGQKIAELRESLNDGDIYPPPA